MAVVYREYAVPGTGGELAAALSELFRRKCSGFSRQEVIAWACIGELYLAHFLSDVPLEMMRAQQYDIREYHPAIPLDCADYDSLYEILAGSADAVGVCMHLPDSTGYLHETWVDRQLIYDMLDFCRDGIG